MREPALRARLALELALSTVLVADLGCDTMIAEALLATLEDSQALQVASRDRLRSRDR